MRRFFLRLILVSLPALAAVLGSGPAVAAPTDPLHAIHIYRASDPGPSGEAPGVDTCVNGKPTVKIFFTAKGSGDVHIIARRTADPVYDPKAADVLWQKVEVFQDAPGGVTFPVYNITAPDDDSEFYVFVHSLDSKTQHDQVAVTATTEVCEMSTLPSALQPLGDGDMWKNPWTWILLVTFVVLTVLALRKPRPKY